MTHYGHLTLFNVIEIGIPVESPYATVTWAIHVYPQPQYCLQIMSPQETG